MRVLIDTSVAIALREGEAEVLNQMAPFSQALLSIVSVVELEGGVPAAGEGSAIRREILDEIYDTLTILPFEIAEARAYRAIITATGFSRRLIVDRMIAATALANNLPLATLNTRDFRDVPGLKVEAW